MKFVVVLALCLGAASAATLFPVLNVSLLSQNPNPVMAGGIVTIRLNVQNTGAAQADNLVVGLDYTYPFSAMPGAKENYTILSLPRYPEAYSTTTLEFKALVDPNATAGEYQLGIARSVGTSVATWGEGSDEITLRVTGEEFADVTIDKTSIAPGEEANVTFTVTNAGTAPLQNLVLSWSEDSGEILPLGSDNTRQVRELGVG